MNSFRLFLASTSLALLFTASVSAQNVGIGTTAPNASAALDIASSSKGLLVPRMTASQRQLISSPAKGLLVYQSDGTASGGVQSGFWFNAGTPGAPNWTYLNATGGADNLGNHLATQALNLQANALTGAGANIGAAVGVGITAKGALNIGQNTNGNVIMGYQAGPLTTGANNLFIGKETGSNNTLGYSNVFIGNKVGLLNEEGNRNVFVGYQSGYENYTGNDNTFMGAFSGFQNTTGSRNLFLGRDAGYTNGVSDENQFVGFQSGFKNRDGISNHFNGFRSGYNNVTSSRNHFDGYESGYSNVGGEENFFSGYQSGTANTSGSKNFFAGYWSGINNTTGSRNWGVGYAAGPTTGNLSNAGAIGYSAAVSQSNSLVLGGTGTNAVKVGIGTTAPRGLLDVAGPGNTYLVSNLEDGSGQVTFLPSVINLSPAPSQGPLGNQVTFQARRPSGTGTTNIMFKTTTGGLIPSLPATTNDMLLLRGYDNRALFFCEVMSPNFYTISDQRLKQNIRPLSGALATVLQMRGVRYTFRQNVMPNPLPKGEQVGVLAQEVERIYPELVSTDKDGLKAVNYSQLAPVLLEAIKEQQQQIETLKQQALASGQRAIQAEALYLQRASQAEENAVRQAAVAKEMAAAFEQRLRALEANGQRVAARP